jgi:hypothetical protein
MKWHLRTTALTRLLQKNDGFKVFSETESAQFKWEEKGKEFVYDHCLYDVLMEIGEGSNRMYVCVNDHDEKNMEKGVLQVLSSNSQDLPFGKSLMDLFTMLRTMVYLPVESLQPYLPLNSSLIEFPQVLLSFTEYHGEIIHPPQ